MTKGKIILAPFPFTDLTSSKVRPALCLSEQIGEHNQIVIAFISSKVDKELEETDFILDSKAIWFPETGLKVKSVLKVHKLITTEKAYIKAKTGELPPFVLREVDEKLKLLFGLNHNSSESFSKECEVLQ